MSDRHRPHSFDIRFVRGNSLQRIDQRGRVGTQRLPSADKIIRDTIGDVRLGSLPQRGPHRPKPLDRQWSPHPLWEKYSVCIQPTQSQSSLVARNDGISHYMTNTSRKELKLSKRH